MNIQAKVFVLLASVFGAVLSADRYSHCSNYAEYNTLVNLIHHDECMNIDSVFRLLVDVSDHSESCRTHAIQLLSNHFGSHARTPDNCNCQGANRLQQYHMGARDGVTDQRQYCLSHDSDYKDLYYQFFESRNHDAPACRTHHSLWRMLRQISSNIHMDGNSCQKDIIFHLNYAFAHHSDSCTCSNHSVSQQTNVHQGHQPEDKCHHFDSFTKLQRLGDTDGCLSANSVWHYLDDLQVQSPECRARIQKHLADKYQHTSQNGNDCICRERRPLVNHKIHRMDNGSYSQCRGEKGTYQQVVTKLFDNIRADGCQNHNYLWSKLEGINNHCTSSHNNQCSRHVDCTEDLIVRAAIQYPHDASDSCVCSKVTTTTMPTTPTSVATTQTPSTTDTTAPPTTKTLPLASATSTRVTQVSTTVVTTQPMVLTIKFSCNKLSVLEDLAKSLHATHPDSSPCDPNAQGSDDAFVLSTCNMTSPAAWRKGANVMADCDSATQQIPTYTPISTFNGDTYAPVGAQSGIFLGCYNNGIKMAIQKCNGVPEIIHVESGAFADNPRNYFVIV